MPKVNPFNPNSPVNPGMFVGRVPEILRLDAHLTQTAAGQPTNFMITGERGIGKSSLMLYARAIAQGAIPIDARTLTFLVVFTDIDPATTQLGLVRKIELGIRRELEKTEPARQIMRTAWEFIRRVEAAGIKLNPQEQRTDEVLLEEFALSLSDIAARVCDPENSSATFGATYGGVLILIDEADNASPALDIGSFLKLLLERLQRHGCQRVMVGLAGLPDLRTKLASSHPSSLRLFDELILERLTYKEAGEVIDRCLASANEKNETPISITDEGKSTLVGLSEGYPHFLQQFGFSAFAADSDDQIDQLDVFSGALPEGGALSLIGDRYYRDAFYTRIQAESYRQVLRIMADKLDAWITKSEIRAKFKGTTSTLDNAIQALRYRGIILSKEGERGVYRLQHKAFAYWIKLHTTDPAHLQRSVETANGQQSPETS
jgi:hypothetical protein